MKHDMFVSVTKLLRKAVVTLLGALGLKSAIKSLFQAAKTWGIPRSEPHIVCILPHDPTAFTQGLHIHDGILYESTGIVGNSSLRVVDRLTGEVLNFIHIEDLFAEGIAVIGARLAQLTWRDGKVLVYRLPDLHSLEPLNYTERGWGMSATANQYLTSNGSDEIVYRDQQFRKKKTLKVRINAFPLKGINDLAWVKGSIYCNVLRDDNIYKIDDTSGKVLHILDCSSLAEIGAPPGDSHVLNGIAYDQQTDTLFITGKRWKNYFQIKLTEFRGKPPFKS
jgi:glutaminyl-peptide cyclotransferase